VTGYNENFLEGQALPLPEFSIDIEQDVYVDDETLMDGYVADYIHYSLVMNRNVNRRSPIFVALNIDQTKHKSTRRRDRWRLDSRISYDAQLDIDYYHDNPWDRGHMARRTTAAWGDTPQEAQRASDETFYYTNSCLQHANLNQDEWLMLEDWVYDLNLDLDGKVTSFSGPIYGDYNRTIEPSGRELALIPAGFFKIVCFINKDTQKLDVRAFIIYQDEASLRDKSGRRRYNNQHYQVTVTEIEELTGLRFDDAIYQANPLYYSDGNEASEVLEENNANNYPENIEVAASADIIARSTRRETLLDDEVDIYIASAMINPAGLDAGNEWISLMNMGSEAVDLTGWTLSDNSNNRFQIDAVLQEGERLLEPGMAVKISLDTQVKLGNEGDVIKLHNSNGARIDWVNYTKRMVSSGKLVNFLSPRDTLE